MKEIDEKISDLEKELNSLKEQKEKEEKAIKLSKLSSNTIELAELIHEKLCHWNHTDGCGWYYEKWDDLNLGYSKKEYYKKAEAILKDVSIQVAKKVIEKL